MKFSAVVAATLVATASAGAVPSLTPDNYDSMTEGKTVFIKFFAPWCGHCKKMAPDWEKLSNEYEGNDTALVAEVDCTAAGKPLCDANGVKGFPTLKYGDPADLEDYQGGRSFSDLSTFAGENLKPVCSIKNLDLCSDEKKAQIEKFQGMSAEDLDSGIKEEEEKLTKADDEFKAEVQKLQDKYQELMKEKDEKIAQVKGAGLGIMKSVLKAKKGATEGNDEL